MILVFLNNFLSHTWTSKLKPNRLRRISYLVPYYWAVELGQFLHNQMIVVVVGVVVK